MNSIKQGLKDQKTQRQNERKIIDIQKGTQNHSIMSLINQLETSRSRREEKPTNEWPRVKVRDNHTE